MTIRRGDKKETTGRTMAGGEEKYLLFFTGQYALRKHLQAPIICIISYVQAVGKFRSATAGSLEK